MCLHTILEHACQMWHAHLSLSVPLSRPADMAKGRAGVKAHM
jgi:hypothetical protein